MTGASTLAWMTLLLPLASAAVITLGTLKNHRLSANLSIGAILGAFVCSLLLFLSASSGESNLTWIAIGDFNATIGVKLDRLSALMLLVVTGVGALIHWYSQGYMEGDRSYARYFASLSLFSFSMLGIVLATNLMQMFIFWELVGVSSYLLIGFWHERPAAADACKKAFITNRLGDFGFLIGIIMVWAAAGSLNFGLLEKAMQEQPELLGASAGLIGLLLFCGAMGKSAQFPLHVWLPDAMEGPTPVSALIHAATMVAAGVFMLCRIFFLLSPDALSIIAWIGGATALMAAVIALQQDDIKRILAYSTLSQLGYMVMAVGLHAPGAAMFHLTTHAFFKAMLFLGAGSVIHALHHEQNIWKMGGLREKMPATYRTFLIGTLALCGVPPLSGFFSKDGILAAAADSHHGNPVLFGIGILAAVLTTLYMGRLVLVAFHGAHRSEQASHAKESPSVMTVPLWILLVPTLVAGFFPVEHMINQTLGLHHAGGHAAAPLAMAFSVLALMIGGSVAWSHYAGAGTDPLTQRFSGLSTLLRNRLWMDEIFSGMIAITHEAVSKLAGWVDQKILRGAIMGLFQHGVDILGRGLRLVQSGSLQTYAFLFVVGVALVIYIVLGGTH
ncbi:MAG: NADH-quinone oxidoreductase subunit L [Verrucomicrobiales bacterium]|jgi:NADH-quinone oxidoreductase subunit L|nr:NADH-quinone oxidoreductase subunit L [Pedosphaera sp.]MEC7903084.1 NADH-quinone oxidoreductase subunit L [Verrucomicrobiota bacterium]HBF03400.1 NADH-quinone oxidoreductase subunit L [Verrucomicrobiales bacterium]HCQ84718.1 NADH-quinone oxidoreductase subunit L [Verrucomicrobiales bacterium]